MGPTFSPNIFKVGGWSSHLKLFAFMVSKNKGGPTTRKRSAFFTLVGDDVGGALGGDKAYRKLALKHHPDKMKRSMKVVLKVFIFWEFACVLKVL